MLEVRSPYDDKLIASLPLHSHEDSLSILEKAQFAWKNRSNYPKKTRVNTLRNFQPSC